MNDELMEQIDEWHKAEKHQEIIDALVPGAVVEVTYSSETGNMWLVMPDSTAGWMRVGQAGTEDPALCDGQKCYVTYEQIAACLLYTSPSPRD